MKKLVFSFTLVASMATCQMVSAITISGSVGGAPTGANLINFDDMALGSDGTSAVGPSGSVTVALNPDAAVVTGSSSGYYAAPYLSGANGTGFGNLNVPGSDTTPYLTSGATGNGGSITLTFATGQMYFGLLWGSIDDYNTLQFYNGSILVDTVTGSQVLASPTGDQGVNGTLYVNIDTSGAFDTVVATSTQYAFEFDNVAYSTKPAPAPFSVPDGGLTVAMLGVAFAGVASLRRKLVKQ